MFIQSHFTSLSCVVDSLRDPAPPLASLGHFFFWSLDRDVQVFAVESKVLASFMYVVKATLCLYCTLLACNTCQYVIGLCVSMKVVPPNLYAVIRANLVTVFNNIYSFFLKKEKRKEDYKFTITICYKIQ